MIARLGRNPIALGFVRTLADMLRAGFDYTGHGGAALLIDYGFPAHEYYLPQRDEGTLMCHYRHRAHTDPFFHPGLQDITAHVDFSAITLAAERGGALSARQIYERDAPGVVYVRARSLQSGSSPLDLSQREAGMASAAGFVIDEDVAQAARVLDVLAASTPSLGASGGSPLPSPGA